ncbi:MAG: N-formylglutamate amidohydrolase [Bacillus sp. (in: Bacteria)]|nr:N-formylglutamate amidohydrolase [Bacillus sp. (in: firmicutes)]
MIKQGGKLPLLLSVPHGGLLIPPNLRPFCLLSKEEILLDSDTWTRELYDFRGVVEEYVDTDLARIVVDLNRSADDLPPGNPDGVVKLLSVAGKVVWKQKCGFPPGDVEQLIRNYHSSYHLRLEKAASNGKVVLGIDCHSMLAVSPGATKGSLHTTKTADHRPLFCISNRGGTNGEFIGDTLSAPAEMLILFKSLIEQHFTDFVGRDLTVPLVTLNDPFRGGFITKYHGTKGHIPWIQLEINRQLYLPEKLPSSLKPSEIDLLRFEKIKSLLYKVFSDLLSGGSGNRPKDVVS